MVSLSLIRARREGRVASRWIGRNLAMIFRKSRTAIRQLIGPSLGPLIRATDGSNFTHFLPLREGCGNDVGNMVSPSAIRARKVSLLESRAIGRNFARILPKSRTVVRQLIIPSPEPLIAARGGADFTHFPRLRGRCGNGVGNRGPLAEIRARKAVSWRVVFNQLV